MNEHNIMVKMSHSKPFYWIMVKEMTMPKNMCISQKQMIVNIGYVKDYERYTLCSLTKTVNYRKF